jgi:hypothetical protein
MKINFLFLFLFFISNNLFSQNPVNFTPKNIDDYTLANKLIAEAYAPRFLHQIGSQLDSPFPSPGSCSDISWDTWG